VRLLEKTGRKCSYCGRKLCAVETTARAAVTYDHVRSKFLGGNNARENMLPACRNCNQLKGSLTLDQFKAHVLEAWRSRGEDKFRHERWRDLFRQFSQDNCMFWFEILWHRRRAGGA
jgi:5-methylcytosine-specific restriction endonuclease McrA